MLNRVVDKGRAGGRQGSWAGALLLVLGLAAVGCAPTPEVTAVEPSEAEVEAALDQARAATDRLGKRLMSELSAQIEAGAPAAAIDVCSAIAPAAADELSREGLLIRRTSRRVRNPANAADGWERAGLLRLQEAVDRGEQPAEIHEVDAAGGELRYLRPIGVGDVCLQCHGTAEQLDSEVRRRVAERYPEDRATGFSAGDLRGAFSVRVRLEAPQAG
jgi:hypothetical protein